ncbi:hypothetical protein [Arthrobacter sp.]|uniref:hypothetical protein n=1 Tax=Arthrobacter sp. TaxID=1667 RepID=UPI0026E0E102|nr:hypothetical protein [Arthrobacter sp.]MDO5751490.1 hypothetical protein [Arthrobacter sp.]
MEVTNKILEMVMALFIALHQALVHVGGNVAAWLHEKFAGLFPSMALRPATDRTRGDVPGWVLITLMSAVLVAGLLAIAGPALERLFTQAMEQVQP